MSETGKVRIPVAGRFLIGANGMHSLISGFYDLAMPLLMLHLTGSALIMSLMFAIGFAAELVVAIIGGAVVDKFRRRALLIIIALLETVIFIAAGFLVINGAMNYALLLAVAALIDFCVRLYLVSDTVALADIVQPALLPKANGILQAVSSASVAIAPLLAGMIIAQFGIGAVFLASASLLACFTVFFCFISWPETARGSDNETEPGLWRSVRAGFRYMWQTPLLRQFLFWRGALDCALTAVFLFLIFYMREIIKLAPLDIGIVASLLAVGGIAGGLAFSKLFDAIKSATLLRISVFVLAGSAAVLVFCEHTWQLGIVAFTIAFGLSVTSRLLTTFYQLTTPKALLGRVLATSQTVTSILCPIVVLVCGSIADRGGISGIFFAASGLMLALVISANFGPLKTVDWRGGS